MRTLHLLDDAEIDLDSAADFYDEQEIGYGDCFHADLLSEMRLLVPIAGCHRKRHGFHCYLSDQYPYGVYYLVEDNVVSVYAILDQRGDPQTISRILSGR